MDGGKLSEVNARTESRRQNELVSKFKMVASDLVSVRGQVMEYLYTPTGIYICIYKYLEYEHHSFFKNVQIVTKKKRSISVCIDSIYNL